MSECEIYQRILNEVHAIDTHTGRKHIKFALDINATTQLSKNCIDSTNVTRRPEMIYCKLLQRLYVLGAMIEGNTKMEDTLWIYEHSLCDSFSSIY